MYELYNQAILKPDYNNFSLIDKELIKENFSVININALNQLNPLKRYKPTKETIDQATRMLIKDKQRISLFKKHEALKASKASFFMS